MTRWLWPARQKREFWSPISITGRSRPLAPGRHDFPRPAISLGFRVAKVRESCFFLYFITRETYQIQPTRRLWPARELESFEQHSISRANQVETNECVGSENTCRRCPPVLNVRKMPAGPKNIGIRAQCIPLIVPCIIFLDRQVLFWKDAINCLIHQASCQSIDAVDNQPFDFPRINSCQQSIHLNAIQALARFAFIDIHFANLESAGIFQFLADTNLVVTRRIAAVPLARLSSVDCSDGL